MIPGYLDEQEQDGLDQMRFDIDILFIHAGSIIAIESSILRINEGGNMGTMRSFSKCDPKRDYTYVECLEMAAQHDYDMMDSIIKTGTEASKEHLIEVAKLMIDGMDDSMSDHGSFVLEELGYDRCPCCGDMVPKENILSKEE